MKQLTVILLAFVLLAVASPAALAQTRKGSAQRGTAAAKAAEARRAAADAIVVQITTIATYLYAYGSVVKGLQTSEQTAQGGKLPPETQALILKNKAGVAESIRNLSDGVRKLELDFGADPNLKSYYQQINKLYEDVDLAAAAADAGKYDDAGQRLVAVVGVLARALTADAK